MICSSSTATRPTRVGNWFVKERTGHGVHADHTKPQPQALPGRQAAPCVQHQEPHLQALERLDGLHGRLLLGGLGRGQLGGYVPSVHCRGHGPRGGQRGGGVESTRSSSLSLSPPQGPRLPFPQHQRQGARRSRATEPEASLVAHMAGRRGQQGTYHGASGAEVGRGCGSGRQAGLRAEDEEPWRAAAAQLVVVVVRWRLGSTCSPFFKNPRRAARVGVKGANCHEFK